MTWRLTLFSPFLFLSCSLCIFFWKKQQKQQPPPLLNLKTTQPLTTNLATTTYVFLFKFYWGFSTLNKQYSFFLFIVVVYIFCLGVYLFYNFFSYKFVVWIYDLYILEFVLDFIKLYFFCKLMRLKLNFWLMCFVIK